MSRITTRRPTRRTTRAGAALAPALVAGLLAAAPALAADAPFRAAPDVASGAGALPRSVAVGDFDSDGRQDLAVADSGRDSLRVLIGRGDGTFTERQELTGFDNAQDVAVADFNADGAEDLAFAGFRSADKTSVTVLRGTGDGHFTTLSASTVPGQQLVRSIVAADFDGDGDGTTRR